MIVGLCIVLIIVGVCILYCSNKHQNMLLKPLAKPYRWVGMSCLVVALCLVYLQFSGLAGLLGWLIVSMLSLILVPGVTFLLKVKRER